MNLLFSNIDEKDKSNAIRELIHDATPRPSFFFLIALSILMASLGLLLNNSSVIIGSMLLAPIMSPLLSLALGIVTSEERVISWSFITLSKAIGYSLIFSIIITWLFGANSDIHNPEIISRTEPSMIYLIVAIISGIATSYARVKPELNETLPGTAIAVALVPPIAVTGIGIATLDWAVATGAFQMFILNCIGVVLSAMLMFSLMNLYSKRVLTLVSQSREEAKLKKAKDKLKKQRELQKEKELQNEDNSIPSDKTKKEPETVI